MQKRLQYFFVRFMAVSYLLASTGFGVHECLIEGSVDILIIKSDMDCSDIHGHSCCMLTDCETMEHDNNCCKTELHLLDTDYQLPEISSYAFSPLCSGITLYSAACSTSTDLLNGGHELLLRSLRDGPFKILDRIAFFASISQWRL